MMMVKWPRRKHLKPNAIVYFDELLDEQHRQNIESIMERVEGVTNAHFNETQHQLMIVGYDPKRTNSGAILSRVKRQHRHAQLI
ncbi:MAG: ATP-binding protein [Pseudomonadota bacterium]|nr:ATP-binding protein [Pseudomonadota bacterium]